MCVRTRVHVQGLPDCWSVARAANPAAQEITPRIAQSMADRVQLTIACTVGGCGAPK